MTKFAIHCEHTKEKRYCLGLCRKCYNNFQYHFKLKYNPNSIESRKISKTKYRETHSSPIREYEIKYRERIKLEVLTHYSPDEKLKCSCPRCDIVIPDFLTLDHIEGIGNSERLPGIQFYLWIKRNDFPVGFQTLCFNCNCARNFPRNKGICPHVILLPERES
jgi:hypothetical protein